MKKTLSILMGLTFFFLTSCNKNKSGLKQSVPIAPEELLANVMSDKQIDLTWTDKSTNETGFKIQRKTSTSIFQEVGTTGTDITSFSDKGLTSSTSYTYRILSYNSAGSSATYSNEVTVSTMSTAVAPTVTFATPPFVYSSIVAYCSGYLLANGGALPTEVGICWNTNPNPTIANFKKTTTNIINDIFTVQLNLQPGTKYYLKAYATNSGGTGYSNEMSFTTKVYFTQGNGVSDIDGNNYKTIKVGNQEWMAENLRTSKFANGDVIVNSTGSYWSLDSTKPVWCYYQDINQYNIPYGKLYNWYAVVDNRNVCPAGWHVPTTTEWTVLTQALQDENGNAVPIGNKLKEEGTSHWNSPNLGANNESGFTALPSGVRTYLNASSDLGTRAYYWTSSESNSQNANYYQLTSTTTSVNLNSSPKANGLSVRCVKN